MFFIIMVTMIVAVIIMRGFVMWVIIVFKGAGFTNIVVMVVRRLMVRFAMFAIMRMFVIGERSGLRHLGIGVLHDVAADAIITAAAARTAMARAAAAVTVLVLFLGFAMGALVGLDQGLTVSDRNLVIVGMDFAEGKEAVAVAAIFDKGGLERWLYPRDLGEVDIAAQLFALGGFEIKLFDAVSADHDDPGLFRMGGIDQHLVGHFGTLGGGGRVDPGAPKALSADATVHLIRG
jgi:hypothetical protein